LPASRAAAVIGIHWQQTSKRFSSDCATFSRAEISFVLNGAQNRHIKDDRQEEMLRKMPFQLRLGGYRLHPKMRARTWKPGESGNPSGVSRAYAEAMREFQKKPVLVELSPGAERMRRWRTKRRQGLVIVNFDVAPDVIRKLIRLGWLSSTRREDKDAITTTLIELAEKAIELELKPGSSKA
jgi:hypothetical protein